MNKLLIIGCFLVLIVIANVVNLYTKYLLLFLSNWMLEFVKQSKTICIKATNCRQSF